MGRLLRRHREGRDGAEAVGPLDASRGRGLPQRRAGEQADGRVRVSGWVGELGIMLVGHNAGWDQHCNMLTSFFGER